MRFPRPAITNEHSILLACITPTHKQQLIQQCKEENVSIFIDNPTEASSGIYAELRGVASEAELERRLHTKRVALQASRANSIATLAFLVSLVALAKSFF